MPMFYYKIVLTYTKKNKQTIHYVLFNFFFYVTRDIKE